MRISKRLAICMVMLTAAPAGAEVRGGTVAGTVVLDFVPPPRVAAEAGYGPAATGDTSREARLRRELTCVVVSLADDDPTDGRFAGREYVASSTAARPKMTQKDKTFIPHVLAIQQGTTVEFPNEDPFFHNVFSFSRGNDFDLGRYKQEDPAKTVVFGKPGVVDLYCDIHRTMRAYIVVVEHPFFTQPDAEGRFELRNLPPGRWKLVAWHPTLKGAPQALETAPGGHVSAELHLGK